VDVEEARTIGQRLREIRYWRGKSLRVVAELAGISESHLSRLERGERQVDRRGHCCVGGHEVGQAGLMRRHPARVLTGFHPSPTRHAVVGYRRRLAQGPAVRAPTAATRYADAW
jgi:hypothetical protein